MNRELDAESIGEQLGTEGVGSVVSKVEAYCAYEEQRIELTNQPKIVALQQECVFLVEEGRDLIQRLRHAPPPGDRRSRRRKIAYCCSITTLLTLAAFIFSVLTFDPFRVGWKGDLYCLGIAIVTPFLLEQILEKWNMERLFTALATIAGAAAFTSLVLLAVIRGDMFAEEMQNAAPVVIIDDAPSAPQPQDQDNFYDETAVLLRLVMAFLAVAMELGAGLALHEGWRLGSDSSEDWGKLQDRLAEVRRRVVATTHEITMLQNEAPVFAARFWRNFYRSMLTHRFRSATTKLLGLSLAAFLLTHGSVAAQDHTSLVIAVDLTQSVGVAGPDHKTEFQKNIDAVSKLLVQVPAGSAVTILGITDKSFAQPDILLSAFVPDDTGYFGERLTAARNELVRTWKVRSAQLEPRFRHTDIIGAVLVAGQIFNEQKGGEKKMLFIFSDMRQNTGDLHIEPQPILDAEKRSQIVPNDLHGVQVYALGVDGAGLSIASWHALRQFWTKYFLETGAELSAFSVLRFPPSLEATPTTPADLAK
jgi:hypothetical protein